MLSALDRASLFRKPSSFVAGVVWSEPMRTDAFFVTLRKTERDYSPTTMYRDYALSRELFHWESQNATSVDSPVGRRYLTHQEGGSQVLLLARTTRTNDWGGPRPFLCLGTADCVSHVDDRPIADAGRPEAGAGARGVRMVSMEIRVLRGDITEIEVDAVVTAANSRLAGGGGVDGAVHDAAGPELVQASRALAPCPAGSAVVTPAFEMTTASWVIHAVGPVYSGPEDEPVLASAYASSLARADEVGARSLAFPALSTGIYGYPAEDAARISVRAIRSATTEVETVLLVAFSGETARLWQRELERG